MSYAHAAAVFELNEDGSKKQNTSSNKITLTNILTKDFNQNTFHPINQRTRLIIDVLSI